MAWKKKAKEAVEEKVEEKAGDKKGKKPFPLHDHKRSKKD